MTFIRQVSLPSQGSTSWYNHYVGLESVARLREAVVPIADPYFAGANDNATFANYLAFAAAETRAPVGMFPSHRDFGPVIGPFDLPSGTILVGPDGVDGGVSKNPEIAATRPRHKVRVSSGSGTSSLFVTSGDRNGIVLSDINFHGDSTSQLWYQTGTLDSLYPGNLHALTSYGFKSFLGSSAKKWLGTQVVFSGHWQALSFSDTWGNWGGSDCSMPFFLNIGGNAAYAGAGRPMLIIDSMGKTTVPGFLYVTAQNDWIGIQFKGSVKFDMTIFGGAYEGRSATNQATRPVIDVQGMSVTMIGPRLAHVSDDNTTNAPGLIRQSGGDLELFRPVYERPTATVAAAFPLLAQTGGVADVYRPIASEGGAIHVKIGSTLYALNANTNAFNGNPTLTDSATIV